MHEVFILTPEKLKLLILNPAHLIEFLNLVAPSVPEDEVPEDEDDEEEEPEDDEEESEESDEDSQADPEPPLFPSIPAPWGIPSRL